MKKVIKKLTLMMSPKGKSKGQFKKEVLAQLQNKGILKHKKE